MKIDFSREATNQEIHELLNKYPEVKELDFPLSIQEHNLDRVCSRMLYTLIREYRPKNYLEVGTSWGGSARIAVQALLENQQPFKYIGFEMEPNMQQSTKDNVIPLAPDSVEIYGDITEDLDKVPKELDCIFWDTNWEYPITIWFLKNIFPRLKKGGLIQIHDWSVSQKDGDFSYDGGNFDGIGYLITLFQQNRLPLCKLFSVWDYPEYRDQSIAASFWIKEDEFIPNSNE